MVKPTVFQICGENQKNVENAESWLKNLILKEQNEITLSDACISNFEESEYEKLRVLQMKLHVVIELKVGDSTPSLHILGITRDVLSASLEVQKMIQKVREAQEELSKADFLSNVVEWQYEHNGQYKPFDSLANMHIELSAQQQRLQEVTIENKHYRVDPSKLQATDDQGTSINLQRISKTEGKFLKLSRVCVHWFFHKSAFSNASTGTSFITTCSVWGMCVCMCCRSCSAMALRCTFFLSLPFSASAFSLRNALHSVLYSSPQ